jgi:hypothetical protein
MSSLRVVEKVEPPVEERRRDAFSAEQRVLLFHVPAARARHDGRDLRSFKAYFFPSGLSNAIVRRAASRMLICPSITFSHVGEFASSKSAIQHCAPEFRALIAILRSTGPVISVRRSTRSGGGGGTCQSPPRMCAVSGKKSGILPASISAWRTLRRASSSSRRGPNLAASSATKAHAAGVRISA